MKALNDPGQSLSTGLAAIRAQYKVPTGFPPEVLAAAGRSVLRVPDAHVDRTMLPFVTLDPASSTDLDQAFHMEMSGQDVLLHYAIADVNWFVQEGDALDLEAWKRGATVYLPDGKASLYPPVLSEDAASLLPDVPRPAVIFTVRVDRAGQVKLDGAQRSIIRSRAKLAYDTVRETDLPQAFGELSRRIKDAENARGAARVDPPEQEVVETSKGNFELMFRPRLASEADNAALSLAANLAIADALQNHHTGLFRVMALPDANSVKRLRHTASAFGLQWPLEATLEQFERTLDPAEPKEAAFMLAIRRAGKGAAYIPYRDNIIPWHAAMAATYAHATAPLRRLADRYVITATLAIANGQPVPATVDEAFNRLPEVMARADAQGAQVERAVIDFAETILLNNQEGQSFDAVITDIDERGARIQLSDLPIIARVDANRVDPGDKIRVKLTSVDQEKRIIGFQRIA